MGQTGSNADRYDRKMRKPEWDVEKTRNRLLLQEARTRLQLSSEIRVNPRSARVNALVNLLARQQCTRHAIEKQSTTLSNIGGMVHLAAAVQTTNAAMEAGIEAVRGSLPKTTTLQRNRADLEGMMIKLEATTDVVDEMGDVVNLTPDEETRESVEALASAIRDEYQLSLLSQLDKVPPLASTVASSRPVSRDDLERKHD